MSREAVALILGRACLDVKFLALLKNHGPAKAAHDMKLKLDAKEIKALENSDILKGLQECNKDVQDNQPSIGEDFGS